MSRHIAIFTKEAVQGIISGKKSFDVWFSKKRIPPFGEVKVGDTVFIKSPGRDISGQFLVKKVIYFEGLEQKDFEIIKKLGKGLDIEYFETRLDSKFATVVFIDRVEQFITSPIRYPKSDSRAWVVLN